jgi:hypothetical protein
VQKALLQQSVHAARMHLILVNESPL